MFNGQRSYVMVANQFSFISDLQPIPDSPGFDPTLSVIQEGTILDVRGTISADRRYVTLTVRPSLARIANVRRIEQSAVFQPQGGLGGPVAPITFSASTGASGSGSASSPADS